MMGKEEKIYILESTHRGSEVEESKSRNKREQHNKKPVERTVFMAGAKPVERMKDYYCANRQRIIFASLSHKSQNMLQISIFSFCNKLVVTFNLSPSSTSFIQKYILYELSYSFLI